jgi:soluble P-type ATPase
MPTTEKMMEDRPNDLDRQKLIRDLAHITKILDEKVHSLEQKLEKCQSLIEELKSPTGVNASGLSNKE